LDNNISSWPFSQGSITTQTPILFLIGSSTNLSFFKADFFEIKTRPQDVDLRGRMREVEGGICKSVIKSGRLSAKLPNLSAPLGSTSCGPN